MAIKGGIRPARERFTLDGREHDGSLAISWDDGVHHGDLRIIDAV
jgi:predicted heme/steroid binding protein